MKRTLLTLLFLGWLCAALADSPARRGTVRCDGRPVGGVVVTDGLRCVRTDDRGRFSLPTDDDSRFIYLSTPAGYTSPTQEGVARFYLPIESGRKSYDFTLRLKPGDDLRHGFIAIADPQIFAAKEFRLLEQAAADIRQSVAAYDRPFHGICAGDITSGDHSFYPEYNRIMATTGLEFRNAMGNHDMKIWGRSNASSTTAYEAMYGPAYYSYNVGRIHYVVLNDNFFIGRDWYYIGYLEERQLRWLENDLQQVPAGSTVVVTLHIPTMFKEKDTRPFNYESAESSLCNHRALYALLEPFRAHIISGHMHTTTNSPIRENLYEHNLAALCGAWWQGNICTDGTPAGYGVFLADGDSLSWHYQSTGHPRDYQLKIYDATDDAAYTGRIVANVWNCDDDWTVELRADGGSAVRMKRTSVIDPHARALYADPSKLDHKWITVGASDHYFTASLPVGTRQVEVIARDRFGNEYRTEKTINNP